MMMIGHLMIFLLRRPSPAVIIKGFVADVGPYMERRVGQGSS